MMRCDAEWLKVALATFSVEELSPLLNLGSSTRQFREQTQPYIDKLVFQPLRERGVQIIHSDIKHEDGVDVVADIFETAGFAELKACMPKAILCTHMLEHIIEREKLAERLLALLATGGLFVVTVPESYHYHADPIDTMYRPTPDQLAALFTGQQILETKTLIGGNYWGHIKKRPLTLFFRHFFRFFTPFLGVKKWRKSMAKLYWLTHPYKVAAIIGRKL